MSTATTEYVNGAATRENARFRAWAPTRILPRLRPADQQQPALRRGGQGQSDATAFARGLQAAGYATDPQYADKLARIINGNTLRVALEQRLPLRLGACAAGSVQNWQSFCMKLGADTPNQGRGSWAAASSASASPDSTPPGGLVTTSHNISNAGTSGYSRQSTVQSTNPAMSTGAGFFGEGTKVDTVKRAYSAFLTNQVLSADTKFNEYDTYNTEISQIDNMLADATVGLTPAIQSFFSGVQEVAANPASIPARQSMMSTSQSLRRVFHNLSGAPRRRALRRGNPDRRDRRPPSAPTRRISPRSTTRSPSPSRPARTSPPTICSTPATSSSGTQQAGPRIHQRRRWRHVGFIGTGQPLVIGTNATTLGRPPSPVRSDPAST